MQRHIKKPYEPDLLTECENEVQSRFVEVIAHAQLIPNFDLPRLDFYDGTSDPLEYLQAYRRAMEFKGANDTVTCRAFSSYLKRRANSWYGRLKPSSISSFRELGREFVTYFANSRPQKKPVDALLALRQGKDESLRSFIGRFRAELSQIKDPNHEMVRAAMKSAVHDRDLKLALSIDSPRDLQELMAVADKYVNNEDSFAMERELELAKAPEKRKEEVRQGNLIDPTIGSRNLVAELLRNSLKDDCYNLKNEVERLVGLGLVDKYLLNSKHNGPSHKSELPKTVNPSNPTQPVAGNDQNRHISEIKQLPNIRTNGSPRIAGSIDVIARGLASGGPTISGQKAYGVQIHAVEALTKKLRSDSTDGKEQIVFFEKDYDDVSLPHDDAIVVRLIIEKDYDDVSLPHDDAIVVRLIITNFNVSKVMIDTGSSVNILHYNAFKEMHLGLDRLTPVEWSIYGFFGGSMDRLTPVEWSIYGFSGGSISIEGRIDLPVTFGTEPRQQTIMQTFLIVKVPSTYNAIIGRPSLNKLEAIISTPHLKIKFPTKAGVGEVRGDQERARNCYANYTKVVKKAKKAFQIAGTDPRSNTHQTHGEPEEELTQIPLFGESDERMVQIGSLLTGKLRTNLVKFLKANTDVFAWSALNMPEQGLFCYKVMPFGLKNAGATYQRLVNKIFAPQIGRKMEVYVDDMLVKSSKTTDHVTDHREAFTVLRKYHMKLNPSKCVFGVASGKFLGFMVSQRGIEANPEKIQAILDMTPPRTVNEVQRLAERIAALS
ncbi:uncharacterized protein LOC143849414 [Tasmannia lanceolata]|uniref:uncharacterized protein LOC143849414 n=1 Tax=Tasmannia lanceolata TaxID=3420 RepID=UPI00406439C5